MQAIGALDLLFIARQWDTERKILQARALISQAEEIIKSGRCECRAGRLIKPATLWDEAVWEQIYCDWCDLKEELFYRRRELAELEKAFDRASHLLAELDFRRAREVLIDEPVSHQGTLFGPR